MCKDFRGNASLANVPFKIMQIGTSLLVQWIRVHLPVQGTWVWPPVREDAACLRATKPVCHKYWAPIPEQASWNEWGPHAPQLLKPLCLEPVLSSKRSPTSPQLEKTLVHATTKTQSHQKKNQKWIRTHLPQLSFNVNHSSHLFTVHCLILWLTTWLGFFFLIEV